MAAFFNTHSAEIFALINLIFGTVLLPMLGVWLKNHLDTARAEKVEKAIRAGLQQAIAAVSQGKNSRETIASVLNDIEVRRNVVGLATDYVSETVPTAVRKLGIDPALEKVISARVETAVAELAEKYIISNQAIAVSVKTSTDQYGQVDTMRSV